MGRGEMNPAARPAGITVRPSGFSRSLASFARNLLGATPTLHVRQVASLTLLLISRAMVRPSPKIALEAVTSRKASSTDVCSTRGVNCPRMSITIRLISE